MLATVVYTLLSFLTFSVSARPAEQHLHHQHDVRHQRPLVLPSARPVKHIEPFSVGATTCAPDLIPNVFGDDLEQFASATAFCSSFIATVTTKTITATPFANHATPFVPAQADTTQVPRPRHAVHEPDSSVSSACSCLITSAPTRIVTQTIIAYPMPTGAELQEALRRGYEMRHEKRIELNDVHAGAEARIVRR